MQPWLVVTLFSKKLPLGSRTRKSTDSGVTVQSFSRFRSNGCFACKAWRGRPFLLGEALWHLPITMIWRTLLGPPLNLVRTNGFPKQTKNTLKARHTFSPSSPFCHCDPEVTFTIVAGDDGAHCQSSQWQDIY